jgi:hypothetical protein
MYTIFWLEGLKVTDHSEELGIDGKTILEDKVKVILSLRLTKYHTIKTYTLLN